MAYLPSDCIFETMFNVCFICVLDTEHIYVYVSTEHVGSEDNFQESAIFSTKSILGIEPGLEV